jgi:hypothetical protein
MQSAAPQGPTATTTSNQTTTGGVAGCCQSRHLHARVLDVMPPTMQHACASMQQPRLNCHQEFLGLSHLQVCCQRVWHALDVIHLIHLVHALHQQRACAPPHERCSLLLTRLLLLSRELLRLQDPVLPQKQNKARLGHKVQSPKSHVCCRDELLQQRSGFAWEQE